VAAFVWSVSDKRSGNPQAIVINTYAGGSQVVAAPGLHQVGDVMNGHQFTGSTWIPLEPAQLPALPQQGDQPRLHQAEPTSN